MSKNVLIILSLLAMGSLAASRCGAQCYSNYSQPYYAPTYYNNVVTTYKEVLVPLFQPYPVFVDPRISYHYSSGNYLGVALAPSIPGVVGVPAQPVQQQPMPAKAAPAAGADLDLDGLIDKIEKRIRERNSQQVYEPDGPPAVPGGVSLYQPKQIASRTFLHVLQSNCAMCHTGAKSKGDTVIFESPGKLSPAADMQAIWDAINEDRMPPKEKPRVKAADKQIVRRDLGF